MWEERYGAEEFAYGKTPNDFLKAQIHHIPQGGKVLCLAEGEGRNSVFIAEQGYTVTGVDSSTAGIDKVHRLSAERGVSVEALVADLAHYDIGKEVWDGVVSIFCHLPPDLRRQVHQNVVAGLKPGGVLILEAYTPDQLKYKTGGPPVAEMTMSLADLHDEFKGLEFIHAEELVREVVEGLYHTGTAAVVQLIARKPG
jgi:SAM-dependent methyltransferase